MLNEDWWIGVSAFQAFAFQSESIPGPSTPAQGVSALSGLSSGLKSGCIGHEAIGIPFGNHLRLRNKKCANLKRHNPSFLIAQPQAQLPTKHMEKSGTTCLLAGQSRFHRDELGGDH